ncbi:Monosaccharide-sensing protein 2 [Sesamum angolense]|uniref:Monosaccharide-sensing protein 2 n=1 Tax=Sesamum angolense TaxID=2727404 RepID=A0AAE1VZ85_9LAMI|nr:Monosaccharide-sensing protein 2 [Sesamum angolense]
MDFGAESYKNQQFVRVKSTENEGSCACCDCGAIGNMLQGWDNATIAESAYHRRANCSYVLIGATVITTFSGPVSDWLGRRPMLIISSVLYFLSGLVMLWAPNVYVLLLARLLDGFGIGLAVTLVPVYISETAPPEIRGLLNTLPQFTGSAGMFLSYVWSSECP